MIKKENFPSKICLICNKPFSWRKKWQKVWNEVKYCSEKCKRNKVRNNFENKISNTAIENIKQVEGILTVRSI